MLERAAAQYNAFLTYQQLAEAVQEDAGIETGVPFRHWIGRVLGMVAAAERPGGPILTSLVVQANGAIGEGYSIPVKARDGIVPADLDMHAAEERLACYRHFGAELPLGGGGPQLTPKVADRRTRRQATASKPPPKICPECNMAIPFSGRCDNCD